MNSYDAFSLTYKTGISNIELEKIISKDCYYSYIYAYYVIKGKFELGEWAISESGYYSYYYVKNVLKFRFKLGEYVIVKTKNYFCDYLVKVMGYSHD